MRLIDTDKIIYQYNGLAHIAPYDFVGITKYFKKQIDMQPTVDAKPIIHAHVIVDWL